MSSTVLKTLAVVMIIAAVVLGFVAFQFSQGLTTQPEKTAEQQVQRSKTQNDQVMAVVAVQRIPAYEPIKKEDVELVPISVEPPQYYTDVDKVIGRTPLQPVPVGAPVTIQAFGSANTLAQAIPPGTQAMSLEISDVTAVGGFIKPGDIVDVLLYLRSSGDAVEKSQARVLLKSVLVLAFEERLINAAPSKDGEGQTREYQRTVVLAVPKEETTRVMLGASVGELRLALHSADHGNLAKAMAMLEQREAKGRGASDRASMPPALAPSTTKVAMGGEKAAPADDEDKADENKSEKEEGKVITLAELAEIKDAQEEADNDDAATAVRNPPGTVIEVFRGGESTRIRRPY